MGTGAYSLSGHLEMVGDHVRMQGYCQALDHAIKPGSVVADVGTGTGIFAVVACQRGARRVYAIEPDSVIEVARQVAADNGFADRIEFIPAQSTRISLPEPVDVVVSDLRGVLPWFAHAIPSVIDARNRFLIDGGRLIPAYDHGWAALAQAEEPAVYNPTAIETPGFAVDISAAAPFACNSWRKARLTREQLRTEPQRWATLDYQTVTSARAEGQLRWTIERESTANGLCVWFATELIEGVRFSNAPGEPRTIYGQAFFPFETPLDLAPGDEVAVDLEGVLVGEDYAWRWSTRVTTADGVARVALQQSTVRSSPISLSRLRRREAGHIATLTEDGEADRFVLGSIDGSTPIGEIASRLAAKFPQLFAHPGDALSRVARLSEKYSR